MEKITISSKIDSTFEFEMTAHGISLRNSKTLFQTEVKPGIKYDVECKNVEGKLWEVTIPKGLIPNGSYDFNLCVIAEEFFFTPVTGKLNVVSAKTIKVSGVQVELDDEEETKEETKKVDETVTETVAPIISDDGTRSKVQMIKDRINERKRPSPSPRYQFFKTDKELEEERLANKKYKTIFTENELDNKPIKTETTPVVEDITESVEIDDVLDHELDTSVKLDTTDVKDIVEDVVETTPEKKVLPTLPPMFNKSKEVVEATVDPNDKVKEILSNINEPTPIPTIEVTETGTFFDELDEMKEINKRRKTNRAVKDAIRKTTKKD